MASASQSKVCFFFDEVKFNLPNRSALKKFIEKLIKKEGRQLKTLNYIFCSDKKLLVINKDFLKHDYYTDIITFELSNNGERLVGEVYISIDRVRDNAGGLKVPFARELRRVMFHGALHLCGYADKTVKDKQLMTEMEDKYLDLYQEFDF